jgi:hypothetical protein
VDRREVGGAISVTVGPPGPETFEILKARNRRAGSRGICSVLQLEHHVLTLLCLHLRTPGHLASAE